MSQPSLYYGNYKNVFAGDFEFSSKPGNKVEPICFVVKNLITSEEKRLWKEDLQNLRKAPFDTGNTSLFVSYYASAEMNCFIELNWPPPARVLDLYTEFRCSHNDGTRPRLGWGLLGALDKYGIPHIEHLAKEEMRSLAQRGGPWLKVEEEQLLDYCASDVYALEKLLKAMHKDIDFPRAVIRGEFSKTVAQIETNGIPIDVDSLNELKNHWDSIRLKLIENIDKDFDVFENGVFKSKKFEAYLLKAKIPWPRLISGNLDLSIECLRQMSKVDSRITPLAELRNSLSKLRLNKLSVGSDGRNRYLISPFSSKTSRNQPSNSKSIYGPACWLRCLIKPTKDQAIAYIDWSQQEFGIAAALSKDSRMMEAYNSGDPYLSFAIQAGAAPTTATKNSHKLIRDKFKACVLAVQYGMGAKSLASRISSTEYEALKLLELHKSTFKDFWNWSDRCLDYFSLHKEIHTVFGWKHLAGPIFNERSLRNFPMQSNGAEMLRLACNLCVENGIKICAPVHDAILIEAPVDSIESNVIRAQELMAEASRIVLSGFELKSDKEIVSFPNRYVDERGKKMWDEVFNTIRESVTSMSQNCTPVQSTI